MQLASKKKLTCCKVDQKSPQIEVSITYENRLQTPNTRS
jgi:hypothetical protein